MSIDIVIPTHDRAGWVDTLSLFNSGDIALCVAASQVDRYKDHYPDVEFVVHPDDVRGIGPKRQWIYDRFGDVFMVDDDITHVRRTYETDASRMYLDGDEIVSVIQSAFDMSEELGVFLFGFIVDTNPRFLQPFSPFSFTGFVGGTAFGLRANSGLWYSTRLLTFDDLWVSALNAHMKRMCLVDRRYAFDFSKGLARVGGNANSRTLSSMQKDREILSESFGNAIPNHEYGDLSHKLIVPF